MNASLLNKSVNFFTHPKPENKALLNLETSDKVDCFIGKTLE